jgi:hypothetical protein
VTVEEAICVVCETLQQDEVLYLAWRDHIIAQFLQVFPMTDEVDRNQTVMAAQHAAENFLNTLIEQYNSLGGGS